MLTRALTPPGGYEPRGGEDSYQALLAALVAHGTNLGVAAMGGSIEGMTLDRLHHASQWFLRGATLKAANKVVADHRHRCRSAGLGARATFHPPTASAAPSSAMACSGPPRNFKEICAASPLLRPPRRAGRLAAQACS